MRTRALLKLLLLAPALQACSSGSEEFNEVRVASNELVPVTAAQYDTTGEVAETSQQPTILGKWLLVSGRDTVVLEFDRMNMSVLGEDTYSFPYSIEADTIVIQQYINGEPSSGVIRIMTLDELIIDWDTGDTNRYIRSR